MTHLVDSDWLIDASRGDVRSLNHIARHSADGVAISIISLGELYEGAANSRQRSDSDPFTLIRAFLYEFAILNLSDPIMETFARLRASLRSQGRLIPDLDLLIAATALGHNLILMTRDVGHFERIPGLVLYQE